MKVLVIPTWYPGEGDKLIGIYHRDFTSSLNKYGIDADIVFIDRQRLSRPFKYLFMKKSEVIEEDNFKVYKYNLLDLARFGYDLEMNRYVKLLEKAVGEYIKLNGKPDVLHAHVTAPAGYATCVVGKKYGIPVVTTEHTALLERFFNKEPYKKYGLEVLKNSYYTVVSKYMKDITLKYTKECDILPNQVDTSLFQNDIKREIKEEFRIVSVCALRDGKGIDYGIKAVKSLVDKGINIHYDVIGDGFKEEYFRSVAKELGMEEHVTFLGRKSKQEISEHLKKCHALLISSDIESFGIPAIEALASGLPVITTDCLGVPSFIDDSCGVVCRVNDDVDMAEKVKYVIDNYSKFDKSHMMEVANQFSEENVVRKAKEIYEKISK